MLPTSPGEESIRSVRRQEASRVDGDALMRIRGKGMGGLMPLILSVAMAFGPATIVAADSTADCNSLNQTDFSGIPDAPTQISMAATTTLATTRQTFCQITGYVAPSVGFELRLPRTWNGKFMEIGCGGHCGS